jgi:hypothetical protein
VSIFESLSQPLRTAQDGGADTLILVLLVAFIVGQFNAWCYKRTHSGVSYSRTFTQALVLISVIASLTMVMVRSNPIAAFGLLGGLAIIRYRTVVRDARDTAYILLSLICGMAAGFGYYSVAIIGSGVANVIAVYLHVTNFGAWHAKDSILRFQVKASHLDSGTLDTLLSRYCRRFSAIAVDETPMLGPDEPRFYQCTYKMRLRDPGRGLDLVSELERECNARLVHVLIEQGNEDVA